MAIGRRLQPSRHSRPPLTGGIFCYSTNTSMPIPDKGSAQRTRPGGQGYSPTWSCGELLIAPDLVEFPTIGERLAGLDLELDNSHCTPPHHNAVDILSSIRGSCSPI